jgi:ribosome-binding protein aMBF1 (putative translation factor)
MIENQIVLVYNKSKRGCCMSKYTRTRHIPLNVAESQAFNEQYQDFIEETHEAGSLLRALRESRGWSQRDLSDRVGLDDQYIALLEEGERPITTSFAKMFADVFDTDYRTLL